MFKLKTCFGMDLRKGCITIGSVLLILELVKLVSFSKDLYHFCQVVYTHIEYVDRELKVYLVMGIISEVAQIMGLLFALILFVGILKNRQNSYMVFLELTAIVYVIDAFIFMYWTAISFKGGYAFHSGIAVVEFITEIAIKLLVPFYMLVILSYYNKEDDGKLPINESEMSQKKEQNESPQFPTDNNNGKEDQLPENYWPKVENSSGNAELPESYFPRVITDGHELPDSYFPNMYNSNSKKDEPKTVFKLIV